MDILRLTGAVEARGDRPWSSADGTRSGTIPTASIRVNDFIVTEVSLADNMIGVGKGEFVDLIVDVAVQGKYIRKQAIGMWPKDAVTDVATPAPSPVSLTPPPSVTPARRPA